MTALADEEATAVAEIVPYTPAAGVDEYRPRIVMQPDEARQLDEALRSNMKAVLREDVDYGVIPGTGGKPTLLKPGAEKLLQWFGFGHTMERVEIERAPDGGRLGVTYRCTVTKGMADGRTVVVATCEGYAGYDEDRFFTIAEDARAKAERKERANAERYQRQVNKSKWEYITEDYKAPWNSVIKMAQKRALVGAALQATSASTLFTQDVEDNAEPAGNPAAAVAAAARDVITGLSAAARSSLDAWYKDKRWPDPSQWDVEQWCAALVEVGRLSAPEPEETPARQTAQTDWLDKAWERAVSFATDDEGRELWTEVISERDAGMCGKAEATALQERIKERWAEIKDAAQPEAEAS